jgi:hypothetical protein
MTRFLYDRLRAEVAELRKRITVLVAAGGGVPAGHRQRHRRIRTAVNGHHETLLT